MDLLETSQVILGVHTKKEASETSSTSTVQSSTSSPLTEKNTSNDGSKKLRVMLCGTHYLQYNGYSRVVYELFRYLQKKEDLKLTLYGFQNLFETATHRVPLDPCVTVVDAMALENPKRNGFGEQEVGNYLIANPQDIVIIYNDMSVTTALISNIIKTLSPQQKKDTRFVSYIDQVYLHQKPMYINVLNDTFDHIIAFTDYWRDIIMGQDISKDMKVNVLMHGFNDDMYYKVPKKVARSYFHLDQDTFYILNLNRNQPRKRWDICIKAYCEVIKMHYDAQKKNASKAMKPIQLMIGTANNTCWDFTEIIEREFKKRGLPKEIIPKYFFTVPRPQQLLDSEVNLLYNAADIGINTCDGEGFGLCNFEHAALGKPQVVPNIGGFRDFFHDKNALLIQPKYNLYVDSMRDGIGGETEMSDPSDFAAAIWKYYQNPQLVQKHGERARLDIIPHYQWNDIAEHMYKTLHSIAKIPKRAPM